MDRFQQLFDDAHRSYRDGRLREAMLLFRQAATVARGFEDHPAWYKATIWTALLMESLGDHAASLALLLDAQSMESPESPAHEMWLARSIHLTVVQKWQPVRSHIQVLFDGLQQWSLGQHCPAGDILFDQAYQAGIEGKWGTVLTYVEQFVAAFDGDGRIKIGGGHLATSACLRRRDFPACRQWIAAMRECDQGWAVEPVLVGLSELELAIAEGQPPTKLLPLLTSVKNASVGVENSSKVVSSLSTRTELLISTNDDPLSRFHPARLECAIAVRQPGDTHDRYGDRLLLPDLRLAGQRFTAGIPAVDDYYYSQPQQIPDANSSIDKREFRRRLQKVRISATEALRYAKKLDDWLECDWRQREVEARIERIDQIADAVARWAKCDTGE